MEITIVVRKFTISRRPWVSERQISLGSGNVFSRLFKTKACFILLACGYKRTSSTGTAFFGKLSSPRNS
ncbi:MAG TPA: hypothetical protein VEZ17_11335, partial [Chitinophagaceae bacterium]|nr:hypothetical protein [Chitinophagaceae bacterium]